MQDKSKLGKRYQCFQCGLKFYDLNRPEPLCPKCGADQRENPNPDPREAILARFKGKSVGGAAAKAGFRPDEEFAEEEEAEEDVELDEEDIDEEDEEIEGGAAAEAEEED